MFNLKYNFITNHYQSTSKGMSKSSLVLSPFPAYFVISILRKDSSKKRDKTKILFYKTYQ